MILQWLEANAYYQDWVACRSRQMQARTSRINPSILLPAPPTAAHATELQGTPEHDLNHTIASHR